MAWQSAVAIAVVLTALHVAFYRLDVAAAAARTNRMAFAASYGMAMALILPFVNVDIRPFIYFQF